MKKVSVKAKIFDTLFLAGIVVMSAYLFDSVFLRWLMELGFVMSVGELFLTAFTNRKDLKGIFPERSHFIIATNCIIATASLCVFLVIPSWKQFILFFGAVISADAGGLIFGRLFGRKHPWFSRKISPNKTYAGYIGEFIASWIVCVIVINILKINVTAADNWFIVFAPVFGTIGDLCASGAKRQLGIKDSSEVFRDMPFLGQLEWFVKSRDGFLDCFDSIASAFIYYSILIVILG